jgi:hypothetical protein
VGRHADANSVATQLLQLAQVRGRRVLPEARRAAAAVRGVETDERDARLLGSGRGGARLREAEVVELADGGVPRRGQLPVDVDVLAPDLLDQERFGEPDHLVAPGPEVAAARAPAQGVLERVRVRVDEPRDRHRRHRRRR